MGHETTPLFIVGSGRSGTQALGRLFATCSGVEMHHEYMIHHVQPLGVRYFHGFAEKKQVLDDLGSLHGAAIRCAETPIWGDSSNKLSWFIPELAELFPTAKFIHIVRDGRKVVSSLYNKLGAECLDDRSVGVLRAHLFDDKPAPPPEKKYWWPFAHQDSASFEDYWQFDQFERMAYHWAQINDVVEKGLLSVRENQVLQLRLEDMTSHRDIFFSMMEFAGIEPLDEHYDLMKRPYNVIRPENNPLDKEQLETFWRHCAVQMQRYDYSDMDEYLLDYKTGDRLSREAEVK